MKQFLLTIYRHQWLILAAVFFISGFYLEDLDIAIHDTYYVTDGFLIGFAMAFFLLFSWGLLFVPAFQTILQVTMFQLIGTSLLMLILFVCLNGNLSTTPQRVYEDYSVLDEIGETDRAMDLSGILALAVLLLVLMQSCWVFQVIAWLIRKRH